MKFYQCKECKRVINYLDDMNSSKHGDHFEELVPNTTDAATEKHVPVVEENGNKVTVTVGSVEHPMTEEHFINWIIVETTHGFQKRELKATDKPKAEFILADGEKLVAVYEYCNLHGLWKK